MNAVSSVLDSDQTLYVCVGILILCGFIVSLVLVYARRLFRQYDSELIDRIDPNLQLNDQENYQDGLDATKFLEWLNSIVNDLSSFRSRRNEYWTTFSQLVVAIMVVATVAILILTKTVSAEAGLPLLSAISGFAIARGVGSITYQCKTPEQR